MKATHVWIGVAIALVAGGCASIPKGGLSMEEVEAQATGEAVKMGVTVLEENFKRVKPLGYEEAYTPLMVPPNTLKVWIYPRGTKRTWEQGHELLILLDDWEWHPDMNRAAEGRGESGAAVFPHFPGPGEAGGKSETEGEEQ